MNTSMWPEGNPSKLFPPWNQWKESGVPVSQIRVLVLPKIHLRIDFAAKASGIEIPEAMKRDAMGAFLFESREYPAQQAKVEKMATTLSRSGRFEMARLCRKFLPMIRAIASASGMSRKFTQIRMSSRAERILGMIDSQRKLHALYSKRKWP